MSLVDRIPVLDFQGTIEGPSLENFRAVYDLVQCVRFRTRNHKRKRTAPTAALDSVCKAYASATPKDQESWTIETTTPATAGSRNRETTIEPPTPLEFLSTSVTTTNGYCSFVLQDDCRRAVSEFTQQLKTLVHQNTTTETTRTADQLPFSLIWNNDNDNSGSVVSIAPHFWIFAGRNHNNNQNGLQGRTEHTDDIAHDGTVHYQLSGRKTWKLRPTQELRDRCDAEDIALLDSYEVSVATGDCLCINTRLWWHQTVIPATAANENTNDDDLSWSISVARDVYLYTKPVDRNPNNDCSDDDDMLEQEQSESMSNKETAWASGFIPMGTELLVDHPEIHDDNDDDSEIDPDAIPSKYYEFLPPTLEQTNLEAKANCSVVLQGKSNTEKQLSLKTIRDIREGEAFVVLVLRQEIDDDEPSYQD